MRVRYWRAICFSRSNFSPKLVLFLFISVVVPLAFLAAVEFLHLVNIHLRSCRMSKKVIACSYGRVRIRSSFDEPSNNRSLIERFNAEAASQSLSHEAESDGD